MVLKIKGIAQGGKDEIRNEAKRVQHGMPTNERIYKTT